MNTYTIETRLDFRNNQNQEVLKYLLDYITLYNRIKRYVYLYCISHDNIDKVKFIQQTALKYNVLQRNINSIYNEVQGEIVAYKELKKLEQASLKRKIESYKKKLTTHQSAAYVIGRSGMGFKDKAIINNKLVKVY